MKSLDHYFFKTYECFPAKGIQNTRIYISRIGRNSSVASERELYGAGTGDTIEEASFLSKMEAIERLCNSQTVAPSLIGSLEDLQDQAIDLTLFPQLSDSENSFNKNYRPKGVMRWVKSFNLTQRKPVYIPEEHVTLFTKKKYDGEGTTNPISTGCAIHSNFSDAILNGIYEVVERDAIALTWLLKLPLKEIDAAANGLDVNIFDSDFLGSVRLYDASTVEGVKTFCLRATTRHSREIKNVLMFSTHIDSKKAIAKLKKELLSVIFSLSESVERNRNIIEEDVQEFYRVDQGALYMAHEDHADHFDFLDDNGEAPLDPGNVGLSKQEELEFLIEALRTVGHEIYVTDMTNRECYENDLRAVKVTVPTLQPISFVHRSRYLDSRRIQGYAERQYGSFDFSMINDKPLAFS